MKKNKEVNIENTEIQKLMDDLLNDYKNQLEEKRQLEHEKIKYLKELIMKLKDYEIPFYSKKHGCSSLSKQSMELVLQLHDGMHKCFENRDSDLWKDSWSEVDDCFNQLRKLQKPLSCEYIKFRNDFKELIEVHNNIHDSCPNFDELKTDDFVFYRKQFLDLVDEYDLLKKESKLQSDSYEIAKKPLRRIVKKINHSINRCGVGRLSKKDRDEFHDNLPDDSDELILPTFLMWTDEKNSISKRNRCRSRTLKMIIDSLNGQL